jgi:NAD+ synthase
MGVNTQCVAARFAQVGGTMIRADDIAFWIRDQVESSGLNGIIVGLSGGIDSATVAGLAARGLGSNRVLGAIMPAHSQRLDIEHAHLVANDFKIETVTVDLSDPFDSLIGILPPGNQMATANLKPRLRMLTLYHLANTRGLMVVGTGNRSELMVGYFTKYGDGGVDLLPLGSLYKRDVRAIAREIGVPASIIDKPPSAGLWDGQTDEAEMGITYEELDGVLSAMDGGDTSGFPPELVAKVERMIAGSAHKRRPAPIFVPAEPGSIAEGA